MNTAIKQPSARRVALGCDTPTVEWLQPLDIHNITPLVSNVNPICNPLSARQGVLCLLRTCVLLCLMNIIKPLSLFTRNHTEPHDRGITYCLNYSISVMLMSNKNTLQKDPYYSKKDTLRWHEANFQIIQVALRNCALQLHSYHTTCGRFIQISIALFVHSPKINRFGSFFKKGETSPYPSCPRHAHHTVTVRNRFHLCPNCSMRVLLMSVTAMTGELR